MSLCAIVWNIVSHNEIIALLPRFEIYYHILSYINYLIDPLTIFPYLTFIDFYQKSLLCKLLNCPISGGMVVSLL